MNEYQQQILEHYRNPLNYGPPAFVPTHQCTLENKSCGDKITVYLLITDGSVKEVAFDGEGCSIAVGTASLLYSDVKDQSVNEINRISVEDVLEMIGLELTTARIKCANLPLEALKTSLPK